MLYFHFPIPRLELVILLNVDSSVPVILAVHPVIARVVSTVLTPSTGRGGATSFANSASSVSRGRPLLAPDLGCEDAGGEAEDVVDMESLKSIIFVELCVDMGICC
jgi:hypothetical protein